MCDEHPRGILAQVVEHLTFNQVVPGSSPGCLIDIVLNTSTFSGEGKTSPDFMCGEVSIRRNKERQ